MTPAELRALLEAATPEPGNAESLNHVEDGPDWDGRLTVALRNLAPLLLGFWEAAEREIIPEDAAGGFRETCAALQALREAQR